MRRIPGKATFAFQCAANARQQGIDGRDGRGEFDGHACIGDGVQRIRFARSKSRLLSAP